MDRDKILAIDSLTISIFSSVTLIYLSFHKNIEGFNIAWDMMYKVLTLTIIGFTAQFI